MNCPRCEIELTKGTFSDIDIELCPDCSGMVLKTRQMLPLLEKMSQELAEEIKPDSTIEKLEDSAGDVNCPNCTKKMAHEGYMGTDVVFNDSCMSCHMFWLDPSTLGAMALLYTRTNMRVTARHEELKDKFPDTDLVTSVLLARKVQRTLMRGFIGSFLP